MRLIYREIKCRIQEGDYMTEKLDIYKCNVCGNIVQVLIPGVGELVCCSQPMVKQEIQHETDEMGEKHAPKREERDGKYYVHVKAHPMTPEHYIQFLEIIKDDKSEMHLKYFEPTDIPEHEFDELGDEFNAIEYCNIHHLWGENK